MKLLTALIYLSRGLFLEAVSFNSLPSLKSANWIILFQSNSKGNPEKTACFSSTCNHNQRTWLLLGTSVNSSEVPKKKQESKNKTIKQPKKKKTFDCEERKCFHDAILDWHFQNSFGLLSFFLFCQSSCLFPSDTQISFNHWRQDAVFWWNALPGHPW